MSTDIWDIVRARLGLKDDELRPLALSYIEETKHRILHYCNIPSIPSGLNYVWASMTIDAMRVDLPNMAEIADTAGASEKIQIGDTSVSPGQSSDITNMSKTVIDKVVLNYRTDLNRYRKLRW